MDDDLYKKSFELFLKNTDEKSVVKKFIFNYIPIGRNMAFLDIGGGDGSIALVISRKVRTALVIEPNRLFYRQLLKLKGVKVLNKKWEDVHLQGIYDFILAAYVVTYFPSVQRERLIQKMYDSLSPGGYILILSIDAERGSWRKIHTYFYKLIGHAHRSSDDTLKEVVRKYGATSKSFKTHIFAKNANEMLEMLQFDFCKYSKYFIKFSGDLKNFLKKYSDKNGGVVLQMVHNAHIIKKPYE